MELIKKNPLRVILAKLELMKNIPNSELVPICFGNGKNVIDLSKTTNLDGYNRLLSRLTGDDIVNLEPVSSNNPRVATL